MITVSDKFVRDEIVEELLQRMNDAIGEVEDEHEFITTNEIIIAGSKIGFKRSEEDKIEE